MVGRLTNRFFLSSNCTITLFTSSLKYDIIISNRRTEEILMVKLQNNRKRQTPAPAPQPFYKKWWFILIIIIIVVPGLTRGLGDGKSSQTSKKTDSSAQVAKSSEPEKTKASEAPKEDKASEAPKEDASTKEKVTEVKHKMGETVKVGDVEYVVNSKSTAQTVGEGFLKKTANGTYLIVNVTVKNVGKKSMTVDSDYFKLLNGDAEYSDDGTAGLRANKEGKFFHSHVNPDNSITGNVVFDLGSETINSPDLQLQVQTGFWGTERGTISLNE